MKTVILNGERAKSPLGSAPYLTVIKELEKRLGGAKTYTLKDMAIAPCTGCFQCWVKTPGICVINDDGREIPSSIIQSDLLVLLTPVTFGGYSSELKKALDRIIGIVSPFFLQVDGETHHQKRYENFPKVLAFGIEERESWGLSSIFSTLLARNAINMHTPAYHCETMAVEEVDSRFQERLPAILKKLGFNHES